MNKNQMIPYIIEYYMRSFAINYFEAYKLATISIPYEHQDVRHINCKSVIIFDDTSRS